MFYPAAAFEEFNFFLVSLWVITCGLAFLETTSNPLILSLGDKETSTQRLNLAQAFNPIGSLTGMVIAQVFVISALRSDDYTEEAYKALSSDELAVIRENDLGVISLLHCSRCFGIGDYDHYHIYTNGPRRKMKCLYQNLLQLFANKITCMGLESSILRRCPDHVLTYIFQYVDNINATEGTSYTATYFNIAAMISFLVGRWVGTGLMRKFNPSRILMYFGLGGVVFAFGTIFLGSLPGLVCLVIISVFMSIMFPTIYGIALKDMGDEAKIGSAGLVMAIVGGALMPVLQGSILDWGGSGFSDVKVLGFIPEVNFSFILPLICLAVVAFYGYNTLKKQKT